MEANRSFYDSRDNTSPADYFRVIRERRWFILAVTLLAVAIVIVWSVLQTPKYRATADVLRQTAALDQTLFGTAVFQFQDESRQLLNGASLIKIKSVALKVKDDIDSPLSIDALLRMVTVTTAQESDLIHILAISDDPIEAADVANSFARQFIAHRMEADKSILASADTQVVAELDTMTPEELASERGTSLTQKHLELGILQAMQTGGFEIVQEASSPLAPFSPTPIRNAGFALIGGLVFAILLSFVLDYVDRRIKSPEGMERAFSLPVLAGVPTLGHQWLRRNPNRLDRMIGFRDAGSPFFEAFRTLRSNLKFYQGDKRTQTLLITSGLPEEGKTVTAVNLALSLALSGVRVVLLEADLRRPMLHEYLKLSTRVGVSSVLANTVTFEDALQVVKLADFAAPDSEYTTSDLAKQTMQSGLLCLTSGPLPPNPGELLSSQRMKDLIAWAVSLAECVIIDTPPVLLVSDALNLAKSCDGVIVATKIRGTTYPQARDVRTILERAGCRVLGVVANGTPRKQGEYYRGHYKGYYAQAKSS